MGLMRLLWATAVGGMRVATALAFVVTVAFLGSLLGFIQGHPALTAWLVLPLIAMLVFENLWLVGAIRRPALARAAASASLVVSVVLAWQLLTRSGNGFAIAVTVVLAFLAVMAVTAFARPVVDGAT